MAEEYENLASFFETQDDEVEDETVEDDDGQSDQEAEGDTEGDSGSDAEESGSEASGESTEDSGIEDGEEGSDEGSGEEQETSEAVITQEELSSLRQMLREQAQEIQTLKAQSQGLNETLVEQGTIDESDLDPGAEESGGISDERVQSLSLLAETMKMNPTYADFDDVCSQANFEQTVDALAKLAQQEDGGTLTEQVQAVTAYIWALPNPYKFVYDIVKQNHPKYQQTSKEQDTENKKRETPAAPGGVAKVAGGSGSKNDGWTAAKIDALPELELGKVPAAVYEQYLANELK